MLSLKAVVNCYDFTVIFAVFHIISASGVYLQTIYGIKAHKVIHVFLRYTSAGWDNSITGQKLLANVFTFTYQMLSKWDQVQRMTAYRFFKMAAIESEIYFWLRFFSDGTHLKISTYTWTPNFDDRPMSIRSRVITTSGFWKRTSAILELYFRFLFGPVHRHRHCILHRRTKFHPNRSTHGGVMTSYRFFKMAAGRPVGFCVGNIKPRTNCNFGSQLDLQIWSRSDL